jgi:hypothetical protein
VIEMENETTIDSFYTEFINELKATLEYREIEVPADLVLKTEIDKAIGEINR